jgi:aldose 1-epimerase
MDFREGKEIGLDIEDDFLQNHTANGYDHPWLFDDQNYEICNASLSDPISGRHMEVYTTYPVVVVYTNNYTSDKEMIDKEIIDTKYDAVCLECQFIPNGINMNTDEDKALLDVGEEYYQKTRYSFKIKENKIYE